MGRGYIAECCVSHIKEQQKQKEYQVYVTDMLIAILQSHYSEPISIPRFIEVSDPKREKEPEHTADEIIDNISQKLAELGK